MTNMIKVLLVDGGRQAIPVLQGLNEINCHITTISYSKLDVGFVSKYPHTKLLFKEARNNTELMKSIVDREIRTGKYDVVIPLGDIMTEYISQNLAEYNKYIRTFIPEYATFLKAFDKQRTMELCQEIGIPCTRTKYATESMDDFLSRIGGYPIVAKPKSGFGSIGFHCIRSEEEFNRLISSETIDFEKYIIQEYVEQDGDQYNVHAFIDCNDDVSYIVTTQKCRWFPVDGGSSCFCRTIDRPDIASQCANLLKAIHWRGCCEVELIQDTKSGEVKVMEINGRTSACVRICQLCGINIAQSMIEQSCGQKVTKQLKPYSDKRMRCIHTDLLWFLKSPNRFKTKPNWFNPIHTYDQIFTLKDPMVFFAFSLQSVAKYKEEINKRSR